MRFVIHIQFLLFFLGVSTIYAQKAINQNEKASIAELNITANQYESRDSLSDAARCYVQLAHFYWQRQYKKNAIEYFERALQLSKRKNDYNQQRYIYKNLGLLYLELNDKINALANFKSALDKNRIVRDIKEIIGSNVDIGTVLYRMERYNESLIYLDDAYKLTKRVSVSKNKDYLSILRALYRVKSDNYKRLNKLAEFNKFNEISNSYDAQLKQLHVKERDSINIYKVLEERKQKLELLEVTVQNQKEIEQGNKKLYQKDESLKVSEAANQTLVIKNQLAQQRENLQKTEIERSQLKFQNEEKKRQMFIGGLLLLAIFSIYLIRTNLQRRKTNALLALQNAEIEKQRDDIISKSAELESALDQIKEQNVSITKSINYAQRIQFAMLPPESAINEFVDDSFILFKPRDAVSGDFYWFAMVSNSEPTVEQKSTNDRIIQIPLKDKCNKIIITAVDCTGHGVPGAFMSMIGFNLLNEIVGKGIVRADEILNHLHLGVKTALRQDITENRDGMDMALCVIDLDKKVLEYSGAKNPLIYIQNGTCEMIKGDKNPIGGLQTEKERKFTLHTIPIETDTYCYIYSDGYVDQFGGTDGRKFMSKKFREFVEEIHERPMEDQKGILDETIEAWRGDEYKQVDDILVIGFKIGADTFS